MQAAPDLQSDLRQHKYYAKVQSLSKDLRFFLKPGVNYESRSTCKKEHLVDIMKHFGIASEYRKMSFKKHKLIENYQTYLLPNLQPFVDHQSGPTAAQVEAKKRQAKFINPFSASMEELRSAILTRLRATLVAQSFSKAHLARLWKHMFDGPYTKNPVKFNGPPRFFTADELPHKPRDLLRYHLQYECPELFIPLASCTEPILQALYERFICENSDLESELCIGVHYCFINSENSSERRSEGQSQLEPSGSGSKPPGAPIDDDAQMNSLL